ncbi:MAG: hypothetical protein Faunusvirus25_10 [Faunusvirus sp.]|jgi:hypothetical protein|uniref:Uncharacterized protein n=1 Tax=Faunusvirus sp. TaxID=2487766 RepID=A0A3G4ZXF8_9VIRU|nr:MAG: hypothetical protein Faunusvirus25_10 [Faunusvirus sp.]
MSSQQSGMSFQEKKILIEAHRDEFMKLVYTRDENRCIEYIKKYDDFYDTIVDGYTAQNILQFVCVRRLNRTAMALIDQNCDLTHQNAWGTTALMFASCHELNDVVIHIIDKLMNTETRNSAYGTSEMMYLCNSKDVENVIKMIDRGYDIYYKNDMKGSLLTRAIIRKVEKVAMKLIDIDTNFIDEFNISYHNLELTKDAFYYDIIKYCACKRDTIKREIIATMDDASPANALYQSFHTTYAVELVDVICDYIILHVLPI